MIDELTSAVIKYTAHVVALRFRLEDERMSKMSRLSEKLAAAAAVAPRQAAKIEARADRIIASEPALEAQADDAFGPHESLLAEAEKGMHGLKHQLAGFVNGDPLEHSAALLAAVEGALSPTQQPGSGAPTEPGPTSGADVV